MTRTRPWILAASLLLAAGQGKCQRTIDHRYATERQYTLLSFPFDWQKTILLGNGRLAYDFGPGPYHAAGTEIGFTVAGGTPEVRRQFFADPLVPAATTVLESGGMTITEETFCLLPRPAPAPGSFTSGRVTRVGHLAGAIAWSGSAGAPDGPFRNVAWGTNRPITYRVAVPRGSRKVVALGICESYKSGPGQRVLELRVEGSEPRNFDPRKGLEKNTPSVLIFNGMDANGDGALEIEACCAPESPDPNVILNAFWIFPGGTLLSADSVAAGRLDGKAEVIWECGTELVRLPAEPRDDALIASFDGTGEKPALTITTRRPVTYNEQSGVIDLGLGMRIRCSPKPAAGTPVDDGNTRRWIFPFRDGTRKAAIIVSHGIAPVQPRTDLAQEKMRAAEYWRNLRTIPHGVIHVPDTALQGLLDVNIRNLYQAADLVDGEPVFQPGPTVYRGLFFLDAIMIGEPLMFLGDTASVRRYLEGTFRYQQPDGRIRVASPYNAWLETPVFVYSLGWYSRWTENRGWMEKQWPRMVRAIRWINDIRESTKGDSAAANFGLFPAGFVDGGLAGSVADFSTAAFALAGLEEASATAQWLGHIKEAGSWRGMLDDLLECYLRAARKGLRHDRFGNLYLPVAIGDTTAALPQRGQYGFFMPLRYARYYAHPDPLIDSLIDGNLAMAEAVLQEGIMADAGWTRDAVWTWFGAMHAATLSWRGRHDRAITMLYDLANHAGRLGTWVEEQQVRAKGTYSTGDGANAEASAYFITAVRTLLAVERDSLIELLPGVPADWYRPGARTALTNAPTSAGRLTLEARVADDGGSLVVSASLTGTGPYPVRMFSLPTHAIRAAGFAPQGGASEQQVSPHTWTFFKSQ